MLFVHLLISVIIFQNRQFNSLDAEGFVNPVQEFETFKCKKSIKMKQKTKRKKSGN